MPLIFCHIELTERLTLLHVLAATLLLGWPLSWQALALPLSAWRSARNGAVRLDHSSCNTTQYDAITRTDPTTQLVFCLCNSFVMWRGRLALGWLHLVEPKMIKKWKNSRSLSGSLTLLQRGFIYGTTFWFSDLLQHPFGRSRPDEGPRTKMLPLFSGDIILITPSSVRTSMRWSHFRITILNGTFYFRLLCSN